MTKRIYFDHNATTPVLEIGKKAYLKALSGYGNPSSQHSFGREAKEYLEQGRESIAAFLDCDPYKVFFNSSATEGNNQVLRLALYAFLEKNEPIHIVTTQVEHSSVRETCKRLMDFGVEVSFVPVDSTGRVSVQDIEASIQHNTRLISVIWANNEVGTLQPVCEIADMAKDKGILFHTDAVQTIGKVPVSIKDVSVDFLTVSAHKLYAPKGVGALYVRDFETLKPMLWGGPHERGLRAGTENVAGAYAFGEVVRNWSVGDYVQKVGTLKQFFLKGLQQIEGVVIHTPEVSICNTVSFSMPRLDSQSLVMNLDLKGISVSSGSACSTGSIEPSTVLRAMGVDDDVNLRSLRVSFGEGNTEAEVAFLLSILSSF